MPDVIFAFPSTRQTAWFAPSNPPASQIHPSAFISSPVRHFALSPIRLCPRPFITTKNIFNLPFYFKWLNDYRYKSPAKVRLISIWHADQFRLVFGYSRHFWTFPGASYEFYSFSAHGSEYPAAFHRADCQFHCGLLSRIF